MSKIIISKSTVFSLLPLLSPFGFCAASDADCPVFSGTYKVHKNDNLYQLAKEAGGYSATYIRGNERINFPVAVLRPEEKKDFPPCAIVFDGGQYFVQVSEEDRKGIVANDPRAKPGYIISSEYMIFNHSGFEINYIELDKIR